MQRPVVLLPQPDSPTNPKTSPSSMWSERMASQRSALSRKYAAASAFEPIDEIAVGLFDDKLQVGARLLYAADNAFSFGYFF